MSEAADVEDMDCWRVSFGRGDAGTAVRVDVVERQEEEKKKKRQVMESGVEFILIRQKFSDVLTFTQMRQDIRYEVVFTVFRQSVLCNLATNIWAIYLEGGFDESDEDLVRKECAAFFVTVDRSRDWSAISILFLPVGRTVEDVGREDVEGVGVQLSMAGQRERRGMCGWFARACTTKAYQCWQLNVVQMVVRRGVGWCTWAQLCEGMKRLGDDKMLEGWEGKIRQREGAGRSLGVCWKPR
ncbi:hypothetical protein DFH29DRAFT_880520 [Suillus ampliporus]|nr:hypothetical protein DFH29DRAFT_880520 [Suillus ampliporus]